MRVEVEHNVSDDKLSRELWSFRVETGYILLTDFAVQSRQTTRHKFRGKAWHSHDERSYCSVLTRPTSIPAEVIEAAREEWRRSINEVPIFIGWLNEESRLSY